MLKRTHLALGLAVGLYFVPHVNDPLIFLPIVLISSLLPDIDSRTSHLGRRLIFRPVQAAVNHRGFLHTYTFCVLVSLILAMYFPVFALPFFLGYSFHLLADSFTLQGIKPFWPFKFISKGLVGSGGHVDKMLFMIFSLMSVILAIMLLAQGGF